MNRKQSIKVVCDVCGKTKEIPPSQFKKNKSGRFYCSGECKKIGFKKNPPVQKEYFDVKCLWCGKQKTIPGWIYKRQENFFCDRHCLAEWHRKTLSGEKHPSYKGKIIEKCSWCEKEVEIDRVRHAKNKTGNFFCDSKCMGKYKSAYNIGENNPTFKPKISYTCDNCGIEVKRLESRRVNNKNIFCSQKCKAEWTSKNLVGDNCPAWKGGSVETNCGFCDKKIFVVKWKTKKNKMSFCCEDCERSYRSVRMSGENSPSWKGGLVETNCSFCGSPKKVLRCKINVQKNHFCDRICHGAFNSANKKGENNGNWRGGISNLPYSFDFNEELKLKIRKRDNFSCQLCGVEENGKAHDVHHIDYDKMNSSEENLICLCQIGNGCHSKTNGNREYWIKYFQNFMKENHSEYFLS